MSLGPEAHQIHPQGRWQGRPGCELQLRLGPRSQLAEHSTVDKAHLPPLCSLSGLLIIATLLLVSLDHPETVARVETLPPPPSAAGFGSSSPHLPGSTRPAPCPAFPHSQSQASLYLLRLRRVTCAELRTTSPLSKNTCIRPFGESCALGSIFYGMSPSICVHPPPNCLQAGSQAATGTTLLPLTVLIKPDTHANNNNHPTPKQIPKKQNTSTQSLLDRL